MSMSLPEGELETRGAEVDSTIVGNQLRPLMDANHHLIAGRLDEALEWYRRRRRGVISKPILLAQWARLLAAIEALDELAGLLPDLVQDPNQHLFAIGQTLKRSRRDGADDGAAVASLGLPTPPALIGRIAAQLSKSEAAPISHVAICGVSFCGSTVMSEMLSSAGAANIGESHWLGRSSMGGRLRPLGFDGGPEMRSMVHCSTCGSDCQYLSEEFRLGLGADPVHWYRKIAARFGTTALISADKNLAKYALLNPQFDFGAVVMFKSPWDAWASQRARLGDNGARQDAANLQAYLTNWKAQYHDMLDYLSPSRGKVFVHFDDFERWPESILHAVRGRFAIPVPSVGESLTSHSIGGNGAATRRLKQSREIVPLPRRCLPADHVEWIKAQHDVMEVYRNLLVASEMSVMTGVFDEPKSGGDMVEERLGVVSRSA